MEMMVEPSRVKVTIGPPFSIGNPSPVSISKSTVPDRPSELPTTRDPSGEKTNRRLADGTRLHKAAIFVV